MLQVDRHGLFVFTNVDIKSGKFDSTLDFIFDLIDYINHYFHSFFMSGINYLNAFSDLLCVHRLDGKLKSSLVLAY